MLHPNGRVEYCYKLKYCFISCGKSYLFPCVVLSEQHKARLQGVIQTVKSMKGLSGKICPSEVPRVFRLSRGTQPRGKFWLLEGPPMVKFFRQSLGLFTVCQTLGFKNRRRCGSELPHGLVWKTVGLYLIKSDSVHSRLRWLKNKVCNFILFDEDKRLLTVGTNFLGPVDKWSSWLTVFSECGCKRHNGVDDSTETLNWKWLHYIQ